ncbi:hypothetical protein EDC04DRAFT_1294587 [Pisolithus marmoratus]|nr:hypothetical protein EDC04DRAFT_1294587 [Pisolithus marmoratus]
MDHALTAWCSRRSLVGRNGCGKSSFISKLTGIPEHEAEVWHELTSKPNHINTFKYQHPGSGCRIVLVDTPGFSNLNPDPADNKVRAEIIAWLLETCKRGVVIAHILYLYTPAYCPTVHLLRLFWNVYGEPMYSQLTFVEMTADYSDYQSQPDSAKAVNGSNTGGKANAVVYEGTKEEGATQKSCF